MLRDSVKLTGKRASRSPWELKMLPTLSHAGELEKTRQYYYRH